MKGNLFGVMIGIVFSIFCLVSCKDETSTMAPRHVELNLTGNKPALFKLGRALFYDTHLSVNGAISCASCHKQSTAFSDNVAFSSGFENRLTGRNSMPIQNLAGSNELFWDGRESQLNSMVLKPIFNHVEMGMFDDAKLVERVKSVFYYPELFKAFPDGEINIQNISTALTNFVQGIQSNQTYFDKYNRNERSLSALELEGKILFFTKYNCKRCHEVTNPIGYNNTGGFGVQSGFVNIGLDQQYSDPGRAKFTGNKADEGKFKIPNLRNVALTAPYMHDGRFGTLDEVLNHYSHNIADHPNLDPGLRDSNGKPIRMSISEQEKSALIAFLNTLTDYDMITNPDLENPFQFK